MRVSLHGKNENTRLNANGRSSGRPSGKSSQITGSTPKILGFDTETVNRPGGGHTCLITLSDGKYLEFPRTLEQVTDFLLKSGHRFFSWNLDFDVRAILHEKFVPYRTLETLSFAGSARVRSVGIKYIPSKFLTLSKGGRALEIFDLAQFYGLRLKDAAKKHLGDLEKQDIPKSWYVEMDACLRDSRRETILKYGLRDAELVEKLGDLLRDAFKNLGIETDKWISPASLSKEIFKKELTDISPGLRTQHYFRPSFYGGRIEVGGLGKVGASRMYDLNSAYPSAASKLGDPRGLMTFWSTDGRGLPHKTARYGAYRVTVKVPTTWHWGPLACRHKGTIIYPVGEFETWCGLAGIRLLENLKLPHKIHEGCELRGEKPPPLFDRIPELYLMRKDPKISLAVKLVLNSLYGKLCETREKYFVGNGISSPVRWHGFQRIEKKEVFGRFACFPLAAAITEEVRIRVFEVLHKFGPKAKMAMTDSVLLEGGFLETSKTLGEWGLKKEVTKAVIFGCGRYLLESPDGDDFVFRGFSPSPENLKLLKTAKENSIQVGDFRGGSLRQWARDGGVDDLNVLKDVRLRFTLKDDKRFWPKPPGKISDCFVNFFESQPWEGEK